MYFSLLNSDSIIFCEISLQLNSLINLILISFLKVALIKFCYKLMNSKNSSFQQKHTANHSSKAVTHFIKMNKSLWNVNIPTNIRLITPHFVRIFVGHFSSDVSRTRTAPSFPPPRDLQASCQSVR